VTESVPHYLTAIGFALGCLFMRVLYSIPALWRDCCRAHYATHETEADRAVRAWGKETKR
jgi:hypothetical protein